MLEYEKPQLDISSISYKKNNLKKEDSLDIKKFKRATLTIMGIAIFCIWKNVHDNTPHNIITPTPVTINSSYSSSNITDIKNTNSEPFLNKDIRDWTELNLQKIFTLSSSNFDRITTDADFLFSDFSYNKYLDYVNKYYKDKIQNESFSLSVESSVPKINKTYYENGIKYHIVEMNMIELWQQNINTLQQAQNFNIITTISEHPNQRRTLIIDNIEIKKSP